MSDSKAPRPRRRQLVIALLIGLLIAGSGAGIFVWRSRGAAPSLGYTLIQPRRGTIIATVNASGQIAPTRTANLSFGSPGRVSAIAVQVGDRVSAGQVIASIDDRDLALRVGQAQAQLAQARAANDRVLAGASPEEIAAARAQLAQAAGQLVQVQGSVTPADLRAAESQLAQAQLQLQRLQAGPRQPDVQTADAKVREAELGLDRQRTQLSAAKTSAELQLQQSTNALTQSQSRYATASQNWEYVQQTGADPIVRNVADPARPGKTRPNKLNDSQRQQYYDAFVQTEAALHNAEQSVTAAEVALENARQAEAGGVELAEGQLAVAQQNREQLFAAPEADAIAAARAQLASAQANLTKLRGGQRDGQLSAAAAGEEVARANLSRLTADPRSFEIGSAQAQVDAAQAALDLAKLSREQATIVAPFAGVVAEVNARVGETAPAVRPAVVLADLSSFTIDVAVDEIDISRVAPRQPVSMTLDALPGLTLPGTVAGIAPLASDQSGVTSYVVRIIAAPSDARVRSGMSVSADIQVARKDDALLVPRRTVRNERGKLVVDAVSIACGTAPAQLPAAPERAQREVTTGLSNEQVIELLGGASDADCLYVEGIDSTFALFRGPPRN